MDGSPKLPLRILETVAYLLKNEKSFQALALAIAGWIKYVSGNDFDGKSIDLRDPMADYFANISKNSKTSEQFVESILNIREVFPLHLRKSLVFRKEIHTAFNILEELGSIGAIQKVVNTLEN